MDTSSPVAMEDLDYVSTLSDDGPGSIPHEPLALVTESSNLLDTPVILSFLVDSSIYSEPRYGEHFSPSLSIFHHDSF